MEHGILLAPWVLRSPAWSLILAFAFHKCGFAFHLVSESNKTGHAERIPDRSKGPTVFLFSPFFKAFVTPNKTGHAECISDRSKGPTVFLFSPFFKAFVTPL